MSLAPFSFVEIVGYPGYYINMRGQVWSSPKKGGSVNGLYLKQNMRSTGHLYVKLRKNGITKNEAVHRLVLQTFFGPCPIKMECRHLNGNPKDNRLENLKWGTRSENIIDAVKHGTNVNIKVNKDTSEFIKWVYSFGVFSQRQLAKLFDVAQSKIWKIVNNKRLSDNII